MADVSFLVIRDADGKIVAEAKLVLTVDPGIALDIYDRLLSADVPIAIDPRKMLQAACREDITLMVALALDDRPHPTADADMMVLDLSEVPA